MTGAGADAGAYEALPSADPFARLQWIEDPWQDVPDVPELLAGEKQILLRLLRDCANPQADARVILPVVAQFGSGKSHLINWGLRQALGESMIAVALRKPSKDRPLVDQLLETLIDSLVQRAENRRALEHHVLGRLRSTLQELTEGTLPDLAQHASKFLTALDQRAAGASSGWLRPEWLDTLRNASRSPTWNSARLALMLLALDPEQRLWRSRDVLLGTRGLEVLGSLSAGWAPLGSPTEILGDLLPVLRPTYLAIDDLDHLLDEHGALDALLELLDHLFSRMGGTCLLLILHDEKWDALAQRLAEGKAKLGDRIGYAGHAGMEPLRVAQIAGPLSLERLGRVIRAYVGHACAGHELDPVWDACPTFPIPPASLAPLTRREQSWSMRELIRALSPLYEQHRHPPRRWDLGGPGVWSPPGRTPLRYVRVDVEPRVVLRGSEDALELADGRRRRDGEPIAVREGDSLVEALTPVAELDPPLEIRVVERPPQIVLSHDDRPLASAESHVLGGGLLRIEIRAEPVPLDPSGTGVVLDDRDQPLASDQVAPGLLSHALQLPAGAHTVCVQATDHVGLSTTESWALVVDPETPELTLWVDERLVPCESPVTLGCGQRVRLEARSAHAVGHVEREGGEVLDALRLAAGPQVLKVRPVGAGGATGDWVELQFDVVDVPEARFSLSGDLSPYRWVRSLRGGEQWFVEAGQPVRLLADPEVEGLQVRLAGGPWADGTLDFELAPGGHALEARAVREGVGGRLAHLHLAVDDAWAMLRELARPAGREDRLNALQAWLSEQPVPQARVDDVARLATTLRRFGEPDLGRLERLADCLQARVIAGAPPPGVVARAPLDPELASACARLEAHLRPIWTPARVSERLLDYAVAGVQRLVEERARQRDLVALGTRVQEVDGIVETRWAGSDRALAIGWHLRGPAPACAVTLHFEERGVGEHGLPLSRADIALLIGLVDADAVALIVGGADELAEAARVVAEAGPARIARALSLRPLWFMLARRLREGG